MPRAFVNYLAAIWKHTTTVLTTGTLAVILLVLSWVPELIEKLGINRTFYSENSALIIGLTIFGGFVYASFLAWHELVCRLNEKLIEIQRLDAEKAALQDQPEVIFHITCGLWPLVSWEIRNKKATAYNIKADRVSCGSVSAIMERIPQLEPDQRITPNFSIIDERNNEAMGTPGQWLEIVLMNGASDEPTIYPMKLFYHNATGQEFQSEAEIFWYSKEKRVDAVHRRIAPVRHDVAAHFQEV
jgi:hypothetical protein